MKYSAYTWLRLWLLLAPLGLLGQVPRFERVVEYGTQSSVRQAGMALDSADNLYVGGFFQDFLCFTDTCITSYEPGDIDLFVISFDPQGHMRWVRAFQEPGQQTMVDLVVQNGHVWLAVWESSFSQQQVNWRKLGLDGAVEHVERMAGGVQALGTSPIDISGEFLFMGATTSQASISVGDTILWRDSLGGRDIFVAKYHQSGALARAWMFGSVGGGFSGGIRHLKVDPAGNIYLEGTFEENLIIGQDTLWSTTNTWNRLDNFLVKLSPQGEVVWAQVGRPIHQMVLDQQGRLIVTGEVGTAMTWGNHTIAPGYYLAALDETGEPEWLFQNSIMSNIFLVTGLAAKGNHIYTYSRYSGPLELPDTTYAGVPHDNFIFCHAANDGELLWHKKIGVGSVKETPEDILLDSYRRVIASGNFGTEFQNYTYLDSLQVVDQYPFGSGEWHYIGITEPDTLLSTSISTVEKDEPGWQAYPNPSRHTVYLAGGTPGQPASLRLLDLSGRVYRQENLTGGKVPHPIDLALLPAGVYILQLQTHTTRIVFRLVKQP